MTAWQLLANAQALLEGQQVPDAKLDAQYLLAHVLGISRVALLLDSRQEIAPEAQARFEALCLRRAGREPLQYLLGDQPFYGRTFTVTPDVLIPRADTETLVACALELMKGIPAPRVLDVCTGSGAIAITCKLERPDALVFAGDLSEKALAVARQNARQLGADVCFAQGDLLAPFQGQIFDIIISNPPYIPTQVCRTLQAEVMQEPRMALDGGTDGLDFYHRLAAQAPALLDENGFLAMEIGSDQGKTVPALLSAWQDVQVVKDLAGLDRVVSAQMTGGRHV